jgi:hypothetical protein
MVAGTANKGMDYVKHTGIITIGVGKASTNVLIAALDDEIKEAAETVEVTVLKNAKSDLHANRLSSIIFRYHHAAPRLPTAITCSWHQAK